MARKRYEEFTDTTPRGIEMLPPRPAAAPRFDRHTAMVRLLYEGRKVPMSPTDPTDFLVEPVADELISVVVPSTDENRRAVYRYASPLVNGAAPDERAAMLEQFDPAQLHLVGDDFHFVTGETADVPAEYEAFFLDHKAYSFKTISRTR